MVSSKPVKDMGVLVKEQLLTTFTKEIEHIKKVIMNVYDSTTLSTNTSKGSKINLSNIRESFIEALNEFEYIKISKSVELSVPDMETFNFSKNANLKILKTVLEGISGTYVEVTGKDYEGIYGKKVISEESLDESFSPSETIYLLRYTQQVRNAETKLKKKFVLYPFSNLPPIRLFEEGSKFTSNNINYWIKTSIKEAQRLFVAIHKGAKIS